MFGKHKIDVEIINPKGMRKRKCIVEGNYIVIKSGKGVRGDPSLRAKFDKDCILTYRKGPFLRQKLVWVKGHQNCVKFYGGKVSLSYFDVKGYFEAGAIKNAGATMQKIQVPTLLYMAIVAVVVLQVISLLFMTGRLR